MTPRTDERELCVLMGNCQWPFLTYLLNLSPGFRRQYRTKLFCTLDPEAPPTLSSFSPDDLESCRVLLHLAPEWAPWGIDAGYVHALEALRPRAKLISFPYPVFPALWPLHCWDERNATASSGPDGSIIKYDYGDAFLLSLIRTGVPKQEIVRRYRELDVPSVVDLDGILARNHAIGTAKEAATDIKVMDLVAERFRTERFFQTMNHVSNHLMIVMVDQALAMLGFPPLERYAHESLQEMVRPGEMPIHPSVIRYFGLTYVDESTRYIIDAFRKLTFDEFVDQYVDFTAAPSGAEEQAEYDALRIQRHTDSVELKNVATELGNHVARTIGATLPVVGSPEELLAIVTRSAAMLNGEWATDHPFPGRVAGPMSDPAGWKLEAAVNVSRAGRPVGHILTTFVSGKQTLMRVQLGPCDVPPGWRPLVG